MTDVVLFHHLQGLTAGVREFAAALAGPRRFALVIRRSLDLLDRVDAARR